MGTADLPRNMQGDYLAHFLSLHRASNYLMHYLNCEICFSVGNTSEKAGNPFDFNSKESKKE